MFLARKVKPYSIEWLWIPRRMSDPFIELFGARPNSTTQNPNTDIDYILTYGIQISGILTLGLICPAQSDHMGILLDIDLSSFFSSSFSDLSTHHPRSLALGNKQLVDYKLYAL
jgi:hypothetical protein